MVGRGLLAEVWAQWSGRVCATVSDDLFWGIPRDKNQILHVMIIVTFIECLLYARHY